MVLDVPMLSGSLAARISAIAAWHDLSLDADWQAMVNVSAGIDMDADNIEPTHWERVSSVQARRPILMRGFTGRLTLTGRLRPLLPALALAPMLHIGSHTTFGMGRCWVALEP